MFGRLAQLVEYLNDIQGVTGSSPVSSTILLKNPQYRIRKLLCKMQ